LALASLKAQETSLTDKLNSLNVRQAGRRRRRARGWSSTGWTWPAPRRYLDTIEKNLADLRFRGRDVRPAEAYQSLAELRVWDVASGQPTRRIVEPGGWIAALAFTRDGLSLIAGGGTPGQPGSVTIFDLAPRPDDAAPF